MRAPAQSGTDIKHFRVMEASVPCVRDRARQFYCGSIMDTVLEDVLLVVTELAANVVKHTGLPETAFMTLTCHAPDDHGFVRVEVSDASPKLPVLRDFDLGALLEDLTLDDLGSMGTQELEVGGQGLRLFNALCQSWEVRPLRTGKAVVCTLPRRAA